MLYGNAVNNVRDVCQMMIYTVFYSVNPAKIETPNGFSIKKVYYMTTV